MLRILKEREDQTQTPEFKRWFGNSRVVDDRGNPLVVYHGSQTEFEIFDKRKIGYATDPGMWGKGFYFSDEGTAKRYGSLIKAVYLSIQNPYYITQNDSIEKVAEYLNIEQDTLKDSNGFVRPYTPFIPLFTSEIKDKGHDGIIVMRQGLSREFIAFYPNQIKSATNNNGEFSLQSNNIYEALDL